MNRKLIVGRIDELITDCIAGSQSQLEAVLLFQFDMEEEVYTVADAEIYAAAVREVLTSGPRFAGVHAQVSTLEILTQLRRHAEHLCAQKSAATAPALV